MNVLKVLFVVMGVLGVAAPAEAAPARPRLTVMTETTYLGYSPVRGGAAEMRVGNAGGVAARDVVVRLDMRLERGIFGGLSSDVYACTTVGKRSTCVIGDLAAGASVTVTVGWRVRPVPGPPGYDEAASGAVTVTAGNATPGKGTAAASGSTGSYPISDGPDVTVRPVVPKAIAVRAGKTVRLPIVFRAEGEAPAEGIYVRIDLNRASTEVLTLTPPSGSSCVPDAPAPGLTCYLPVRLTPGRVADAWGTANPFLITAAKAAARAEPHGIIINVSPGNGTFRHVGLGAQGRFVIRPTVPLTVSVNGNYHDTQDALVPLRVPVAGSTAGLPITSGSAISVALVGLMWVMAGAVTIVATRRRRAR